MKLELNKLGIISGDSKRKLEDYVHPFYFEQRKSYDEYYVKVQFVEVNLDIGDLHILAENFTVNVLTDSVAISEM